MPSSTSSSSLRLPAGPWLRVWACALISASVFVGSWEITWRLAGFVPSVEDDLQAWAVNRNRVKRESTVFLGTSRSQSALDPREWSRMLGASPPIQLSVPAASVIPLLEHFANDHPFAGTIVADFIPRIEFDATRERESRVVPYLSEHQAVRSSPSRYFEAHLRFIVPASAGRNPALAPGRLLPRLAGLIRRRGEASVVPSPPYYFMRKDRFRPLDFRKVDAERRARELLEIISTHGRPANTEEIGEILVRIEQHVGAIQERGGAVVFVHFPRCGETRAVEEQRYPRRQYWDRLVTATSAATVHAEDIPPIAELQCPDGSHLDLQDTKRFTQILATVVDRVLSPR